MQLETTSRERTIRVLYSFPGKIGASRIDFTAWRTLETAKDLNWHRAGEVLAGAYKQVVEDSPFEPPVEAGAAQ